MYPPTPTHTRTCATRPRHTGADTLDDVQVCTHTHTYTHTLTHFHHTHTFLWNTQLHYTHIFMKYTHNLIRHTHTHTHTHFHDSHILTSSLHTHARMHANTHVRAHTHTHFHDIFSHLHYTHAHTHIHTFSWHILTSSLHTHMHAHTHFHDIFSRLHYTRMHTHTHTLHLSWLFSCPSGEASPQASGPRRSWSSTLSESPCVIVSIHLYSTVSLCVDSHKLTVLTALSFTCREYSEALWLAAC